MSAEPHAAAEMSGEFSRRQEMPASGFANPGMFGGPGGSRNPGGAKAPPWSGHSDPKGSIGSKVPNPMEAPVVDLLGMSEPIAADRGDSLERN